MDVDKIKQFFILHFEKMLLALVLAGALFLVYSGLQKPNFLEEHQPDKLAANASRVKLEIDDDHTAAIIPDRIPTFDILKQTKILDTPVPPSIYKPKHLWEPQSENSIVRRQDPLLLPPVDLRTHGVLTTIAIKGSTTEGDYPLASLEAAEEVEKVENPQPRKERSSNRRGGGMEEMMQMQMEQMMQMQSMSAQPEMTMMSGGANRRLTPKFDFGFRPIMGKDKRYPKPSTGWFIAGTALLPHREIYEAYELALKDADGYNPMRDTPLYFDFQVSRADVTDKTVEQLVEADWVEIMDLKKYAQLAAGYWSGFAPEVIPDDYRDKQVTIWIPPVLLDDYRTFSSHPRIPMLSKAELTRAEIKQEAEEKANSIGDFEFDEEADVTLNVPGAGMAMMSGPMGGMDQMDMMSGGGMMMFGSGKVEEDPVDHKLMRFYDFAGSSLFKDAPVFGRTYVYRLRYAVVDPNFPASQTMQPKTSSLAPEVARRVVDLMNDAVASKKRNFRMWSEWSAPSEPATLPTLEEYFVGPVEGGSTSTWSVNGKPVEYSRDIPKAKMVVSQFVPKYSAKVPMQIEVTEGSVLTRKAESADVVDPVSLDIKKYPEPDFVSSTTVVDVNGGKPMQIVEELTEPGLILLFDQSGTLRLNKEIEDQEFYRIKSFAEEKGE